MIYFERNQSLISEIFHQQRAIEPVAIIRLSCCKIAAVPLVTALVEIECGLRRHEVRIIIIVVTGVPEKYRAYGRTVGSGGIAKLEDVLVGGIVSPKVLEQSLRAAVV